MMNDSDRTDLERRLIATGMAPCQPPQRDLHAAPTVRGLVLALLTAAAGWTLLVVFLTAGLLLLYGVCE